MAVFELDFAVQLLGCPAALSDHLWLKTLEHGNRNLNGC